MKFGGKLFIGLTLFYFLVTSVYWYMSKEVIGTTVLALTGGLAFLIGFYTLFTSNRVGALPEDVEHAKISDIDPDYGFFSPHSWTPFAIGLATWLFILGFAFARWLMVLGTLALIGAVAALLFEYYRGEFVK
jgi:hypothetical protein